MKVLRIMNSMVKVMNGGYWNASGSMGAGIYFD